MAGHFSLLCCISGDVSCSQWHFSRKRTGLHQSWWSPIPVGCQAPWPHNHLVHPPLSQAVTSVSLKHSTAPFPSPCLHRAGQCCPSKDKMRHKLHSQCSNASLAALARAQQASSSSLCPHKHPQRWQVSHKHCGSPQESHFPSSAPLGITWSTIIFALTH